MLEPITPRGWDLDWSLNLILLGFHVGSTDLSDDGPTKQN